MSGETPENVTGPLSSPGYPDFSLGKNNKDIWQQERVVKTP